MVAVELEALREAYAFVDSAQEWQKAAYISLETGRIWWVSDMDDIEEDLPDDLEESDRFLLVPDKHDLDLGTRLVMRFAAEVLPERHARIAGFFERRGAYGRFKDFLAEQQALERWYCYEAEATDRALRAWCAEHGIELIEKAT